MGEEAVGSHHGQRDHHQVAELEVFGDRRSHQRFTWMWGEQASGCSGNCLARCPGKLLLKALGSISASKLSSNTS